LYALLPTAIDVFNHMSASGVECDAVACCSLITALDKGGHWQLAEQVRFRCTITRSITQSYWQLAEQVGVHELVADQLLNHT
jgi:hypothetical protein